MLSPALFLPELSCRGALLKVPEVVPFRLTQVCSAGYRLGHVELMPFSTPC